MGSGRAVFFFIAGLFAFLLQKPAFADGISGEWTIRLEVGDQSTEYSLELTQSGDAVRGFMVSPRSKKRYPIEEGSFRDSTLRFKVPEKKAEVVAKLEGERLEGTFKAEAGSGKLLGKPKGPLPKEETGKKPTLAGKWRTTATLPDGREMAGILEVVEREGKLSGTLGGERGSIDLKSIAVGADGKVVMALVIPTNSGDREIALEAAFDGPDRLKGRWSAQDGSASGEWSARRETPARPEAKSTLFPRYVVVAKLPDGDTMSIDLRPEVKEGRLTGVAILEDEKRIEIMKGSFKEGRIEIELDVPYRGSIAGVKISGEAGEKGLLKGTWRSDEGSGEWIARPVEEL